MNFNQLIYPINKKIFFNEYWEKRPLLISRGAINYYNDLCEKSDVHNFITDTQDMRYPQLRLIKNGNEIDVTKFSVSKKYGSDKYTEYLLDKNKILSLFRDGASIVLNQYQRNHKKLNIFCEKLRNAFNSYVQANLYYTPKQSTGFTPHYDGHDVFVLQIYGEKKWKVYSRYIEYPTVSTLIDALKVNEEPVIDVTLKQGDLLYIPRGYVHSVHTEDKTSIHISLGVFPPNYLNFIRYITDFVINSTTNRSIPILPQKGFDVNRASEYILDVFQSLSIDSIKNILKEYLEYQNSSKYKDEENINFFE